jgi:hypothetical protein
MATLEVHDAEGRVQFVELTHDHPVLFGTSATCDVRLEGAGIRPVHGRIRWKGKRYKVEASPDAEYILLNGTRMTSGSLHAGDEIGVGPCRMVLIRPGAQATVRRSTPEQGSERTPLMAAPIVQADPEKQSSRHRGAGRSPARGAPSHRGEPLRERDEWLEALQHERPSKKERPAAAPRPLAPREPRTKDHARAPSAARCATRARRVESESLRPRWCWR